MINAGIIGTGWIAEMHAQAMQKTTQFRIFGAYDIDQNALEKFCESYSARKFSSVDDMLNAPEIEVVYICTRHDSHPDYSIKALIKGKHVFLEKPAALSGCLAQTIAKEHIHHPLAIAVGYNMRVAPTIARLKELLNKKLVRPFAFRANMTGTPFMQGWAGGVNQGGGVLVCQGSHVFDLISYLISSQVEAVLADTFYINQEADLLPNAASIIVRMKDGTRGTILLHDQGHHAYHVNPGGKMINVTIYSPQGTFSADAYGDLKWGDSQNFVTEQSTALAEQVECWGYQSQAAWFARMLRNETTPLCDISQAVQIAHTVDAAIESANSGKWVRVHAE